MGKLLKKCSVKLIVFLVSLIYVIPIWMVLINSFKTSADANMMSVFFPIDGIVHLENYIQVFNEGGIAKAFFNGLIEATVSVVIITVWSLTSAILIISLTFITVFHQNFPICHFCFSFFVKIKLLVPILFVCFR